VNGGFGDDVRVKAIAEVDRVDVVTTALSVVFHQVQAILAHPHRPHVPINRIEE
jgi:hypothetical protein